MNKKENSAQVDEENETRKKAVVVILADRHYVKPAKAMFSSIYHNSGWKGDYLLMVEKIPQKDLKWFISKGIKIRYCKNPCKTGWSRWGKVIFNKFLLLSDYFKQWDIVVFLDADMLVMGSLDKLLDVEGFAAVPDFNYAISHQFEDRRHKLYKELEREYDMDQLSFNVGAMVFNTHAIGKDDYKKIVKLFKKYQGMLRHPEQAIFNLFFYKKWERLSYTYNYPIVCSPFPKINFVKQPIPKALVYHLLTPVKPWKSKKLFYDQWKFYYDQRRSIDLNKIPDGKLLDNETINTLNTLDEDVLKLIRIDILLYDMKFHYLDRFVGLIGKWIKKRNRPLYNFLVKLK